MAAYGGAGFDRATVDKRATAATRKVAGTPAKGRPENGVVSTVFDSCRRSPVMGPSDGKWHTCLSQKQAFLRSNRRPRTRHDIAQSPLLEFSR